MQNLWTAMQNFEFAIQKKNLHSSFAMCALQVLLLLLLFISSAENIAWFILPVSVMRILMLKFATNSLKQLKYVQLL